MRAADSPPASQPRTNHDAAKRLIGKTGSVPHQAQIDRRPLLFFSAHPHLSRGMGQLTRLGVS
jgi:hypothetical protein